MTLLPAFIILKSPASTYLRMFQNESHNDYKYHDIQNRPLISLTQYPQYSSILPFVSFWTTVASRKYSVKILRSNLHIKYSCLK
ncbi:hypothetical protein BJ095_13419 [Ureibacillus chungkukjangi]|uniref:Uncharacterized protein n=1 Tax=Ureibacillus chungkukjangi TaxID=1202712 RepID=A0A318TEU2_9BACL|nr:hypothetical protein BJ095_13419 [Ureibacillus chungkukjangi]